MNSFCSSKSIFLCVIILLFSYVLSFAQFNDRRLYYYQSATAKPETYFSKPIFIVDTPTASILRGGDFRAGLRMYEQGGLLARLSAGISNKVMFGVSFGGLNIIGEKQKIEWNRTPGVQFVYRIVEEADKRPAFVLGFDSQGYGPFYSADTTEANYNPEYPDQYFFKSRGFYFIGSKNIPLKGIPIFDNVGFSAGFSYSLETAKESKVPTLFMSTNALLARDLSFLAEYDFAIKEKSKYPSGLLNCGLRWAFGPNMFFEFDFENILGKEKIVKDNGGEKEISAVRRILRLTYYGHIVRY